MKSAILKTVRCIATLGLILVSSQHAYSAPACSEIFSDQQISPKSFLNSVSKFMHEFPTFDTWDAADRPKGAAFQKELLASFAKVDLNSPETINFRNSLSGKSIDYVLKNDDGTQLQTEYETNTRLKLYGHVLGAIDGSLIVLAPDHTRLNGGSPDRVKISLFLVRKVAFPYKDSANVLNQLSSKIAETDALTLNTFRALFLAQSPKSDNFDSFNQSAVPVQLNLDGQPDFYYVKKSVDLFRDHLKPDSPFMQRFFSLIGEHK